MPLIFSSEKIYGMLGVEPRAAGSSSKYADHFAMLPPNNCFFKNVSQTVAIFHHKVALKFSDLK